MDLLALKAEITTDPTTIGYAPHVAAGNLTEVARLLNLPRTAGTVKVVPKVILLQAIGNNSADYTGLQAGARQLIDLLIGGAGDDVPVTTALQTAFPAGSLTRAAVLAAISKQLSRAEVLFSESVTEHQIADALKLP